jgi:hypothetical protein
MRLFLGDKVDWWVKDFGYWGVKLLVSVDISTHAPWIMLNEQHIMACTSTRLMIVLGCRIPHELDALKWKAIGRRRRDFGYNRKISWPPL